MLVMLTRLVRLGFSRERQALYSLPKQVKDVLALRGLSSQTAYFRLEGTKIELPNDSYLHTVSGPSGTQLQFLDTHLNYFHPATPIMRLLVGSFFLKWEGDLYYIMTNEPLIPTPTNPLFELAEGSAQLEGIVGESLRELERGGAMDRQSLHNLLMKNVLDRSETIKMEKIRLKEIMKVVEEKVSILQHMITEGEVALKRKSEKRVKLFTSVLIAQAAALHYFIYFNLSWDIMEPVTVILGNFDLFFAYYFFLIKGKQFSPQTWQQELASSRRRKYLTKLGIDVDKYEQYLELRQMLQLRLGLLSKSPLRLFETLQKPLKLLDSR